MLRRVLVRESGWILIVACSVVGAMSLATAGNDAAANRTETKMTPETESWLQKRSGEGIGEILRELHDGIAHDPRVAWGGCSQEEAAVAAAREMRDNASDALALAHAALAACESGSSGP